MSFSKLTSESFEYLKDKPVTSKISSRQLNSTNNIKDNCNQTDESTQNTKRKYTKCNRIDRTNAAKGSKHVIRRSGATPGIQKNLIPNPIKITELCIGDVEEQLLTFKCKSSPNSNCFMKCILTNSTGIRYHDGLYQIIQSCRNQCSKLNNLDREEFLLEKVKASVVNVTKVDIKTKDVEGCRESCKLHQPRNENCLPCFTSNTNPEESAYKLRFKHNYELPENRSVFSKINMDGSNNEFEFPTRKLCRYCFAFLYKFSVYEIEHACDRLKENEYATEFFRKSFRDNNLHPFNHSEAEIIFSHNLVHETFSSCDRSYEDEMITNALLPVADVDLALWLEDCFLTYGDSAPNRNIKQISTTFKNDIWKMYEKEMVKLKLPVVDESRFNEIWLACFPSYLVRPYANVVGKCDICYKIDYQRRASTSKEEKQALRQAHLMHRGGLFMPERRRFVSIWYAVYVVST